MILIIEIIRIQGERIVCTITKYLRWKCHQFKGLRHTLISLPHVGIYSTMKTFCMINSNNYMIELYTDHLLIVCQKSYRTTLLKEFFKFRRKNNLQYCLYLNLKSFNFLSTILKHIYTIEINKHYSYRK